MNKKLKDQLESFQEHLDVLINLSNTLDKPVVGHGGYLDGLQGELNKVQDCLDMASWYLKQHKII